MKKFFIVGLPFALLVFALLFLTRPHKADLSGAKDSPEIASRIKGNPDSADLASSSGDDTSPTDKSTTKSADVISNEKPHAGSTDATKKSTGGVANSVPLNSQRDVHSQARGLANTPSVKLKIKNFFEKRGPGNWILEEDEKTGDVFSILGGEVPDIGRDPTSVLAFVGDLAETMGLPREQLSENLTVDATASVRVYDVHQIYQGYPVYEGTIRVIANRETDTGFIFNNSLKSVKGDFTSRSRTIMSIDQAEASLTKKCECSIVTKYSRKGPFIWPGEPQHLAYEFHFRTSNDTLRSVVSAESGAILSKISTVMY